MIRLTLALLDLHDRITRLAVGERGDENITKVFYAVLGVTIATVIAAAVTAYVNGKLPMIGGSQ